LAAAGGEDGIKVSLRDFVGRCALEMRLAGGDEGNERLSGHKRQLAMDKKKPFLDR